MDMVHDFTGYTTEPNKKIMKGIVDTAIKMGPQGFQGTDLREIKELVSATPEKRTDEPWWG